MACLLHWEEGKLLLIELCFTYQKITVSALEVYLTSACDLSGDFQRNIPGLSVDNESLSFEVSIHELILPGIGITQIIDILRTSTITSIYNTFHLHPATWRTCYRRCWSRQRDVSRHAIRVRCSVRPGMFEQIKRCRCSPRMPLC